MVMLVWYYSVYKIANPFDRVWWKWEADCSDVDRCWRLSYGRFTTHRILTGIADSVPTTFVCTAPLSAQLPLWSNNRHCAECPAWSAIGTGFRKTEACDPARFGDTDGLAGTYLDFWSGETNRSANQSARFIDIQGPYSRTCSESRKSNGHGRAGWRSSDRCVDCFGNDCVEQRLSDIPYQMGKREFIKTHCQERFACSAFDFDNGKCDENFFASVCDTSHGRAAYPRRFSELPGFEFFRNWTHSYVESCSLSDVNITDVTALLTPNERLRLEALCHLHKRCVREHPDFECPLTRDELHARRVREKAGKADSNTWNELPLGVVSHQPRFGGLWNIIATIFIFYMVACDVAHTCYMSNQNLLFLDVASQQRQRRRSNASVSPLNSLKHGEAEGEQASRWQACRRTILGWAARALQHVLRNSLAAYTLYVTLMSVIAEATALNILFCGTIMLLILQLDNLQMQTLLTERQQLEIATQYSVVITKKQERMLQQKLTIEFWAAWLLLIFGYVVELKLLGDIMEHPDSMNERTYYQNVGFLVIFLFILIITVANAVRRVWTSEVNICLACKFFVLDLCIGFIYALLTLIWGYWMILVFTIGLV